MNISFYAKYLSCWKQKYLFNIFSVSDTWHKTANLHQYFSHEIDLQSYLFI